MNVFNHIRTFKHFIMLLGLGLLLSACSENRPLPAVKDFDAAVRAGDLDQQAKALKLLVEQSKTEDISNYQMMLEDINVVKQLNQRAKDRLSLDKFAALDIAISADKKRRNKASKSIIADILRPYVPYYDIKPYLQQWSYPSVDKVVVKGLVPNPLYPWSQPLSIPAIWPDKQLIKLLQTPNSDMLSQLKKFRDEHHQWLEIDRLGARLHDRNDINQHDAILALETTPEITAFYEDVVAINQMYNTIVSDLRYYYLSGGIHLAEQQLADQINAIELSLTSADATLTDKQIWDDKLLDWQNLQYCCQNAIKILGQGFAYLPSPNSYTQQMSAVNGRWHNWIENWSVNLRQSDKKFSRKPDSNLGYDNESTLTQPMRLEKLQALKIELADIKQHFLTLKEPHLNAPRRAIAQDYLQVSIRWHQGDFGTIETLLPHISAYRTSIVQH